MKPVFKILAATVLLSGMTACASVDSQNNYSEADVGRATTVEFGTVVGVRSINIQGENSGFGGLAGAAGGGALGSTIGGGSGKTVSVVAGAILGALAGNATENEVDKRQGIEYTVTEENGKTITVAQNIAKTDKPLGVGDRVMVQTSGKYIRVLPANALPTSIKRPKGIQVKD